MPLIPPTTKNRLILGLMTFGPNAGAGARVTTMAEYTKCLDHFQSAGYTEIDTARSYVGGTQEGWTADAQWKERGLTLATKCYPNKPGTHKPANLRAQLEKSLKELRAECVDIYYLHAADRSVPLVETLEECNALHREGKFVRLGLSNFMAFEIAEAAVLCADRGWVLPSVYQGMYNAITRSIDTEVIPACHKYGLDIVVYNPLAGGLFSGKIKTADVPAEGRFSATYDSQGSNYRKRYFRDATFDALRIVEEAAKAHGLSMIEIAIRWLVHHSALRIKDGGHDGVIVGVSSFKQLEGNMADFEKGPLPEDVVKALDEAWLVNKPTAPDYWHLALKYTYDTREALVKAKV